MASLGSSSGLLFITGFINDLEAMGNVVLITLENDTTLGRAETSGESRRKSSERCREAADGSRGPGNTTAGFYLIQAPRAFLWFSPDKRAPIAFVDVEEAHERSDRRVWFEAGTHGEPSRCPRWRDGAWPAVLAAQGPGRTKSIGSQRRLISEVLPASILYSGA